MTEKIDDILEQRQATHGDYGVQSLLAWTLKRVIKNTVANELPSFAQEALDMICVKIARIVCGDFLHIDSWLDLSGYSQLVIREIEKIKEGNGEYPLDVSTESLMK